MTSKGLLITMLAAVLFVVGCSAQSDISTFNVAMDAVGNATTDILQIVAISKGIPVDPAIQAKVAFDIAGSKQVFADFVNATPAGKITLRGEVTASFGVLNTDLGTILQITQVPPDVQAKVALLIDLVQQGIQIAEDLIPSAPGITVVAKAKYTPNDLIVTYNKVLTAKTGNKQIDKYTQNHQIHYHGKLARYATVGILK